MSHLIGTPYQDRFTVVASDGTLITGESFTADQVLAPDGQLFAWSVAELGNGLYQVGWDVALAGTYYLRLVTTGILLDPPQVFEFQLATDEAEPGSPVQVYFTVRDSDGVYADGAAITIEATYDGAGNPFAVGHTGHGAGLYSVSWDPDSAGMWTVRLLATLTNPEEEPQRFEFEELVVPLTEATVSPFITPYGPSLDDLVRATARACKDFTSIRALEDGSATERDTWPRSLALIARSPKTFMGADLFVTSAAIADNVGREVRIVDSHAGTLDLEPALPGVVRRGDEAYIVNLESNGFSRQHYVEVLGDTIEGAFPNALRPAVWTFGQSEATAEQRSAALFSSELGYLIPPEEFTHLYSVSYYDPSWMASPEHVIFTEYTTLQGWYWDAAAGRLLLTGDYRRAAHGVPVTIRGYGRWERLREGSERTGVDMQWLVEMTAGNLIASVRDARRMSEAAMHTNRADGYLVKMLTQVPAGTYRIR